MNLKIAFPKLTGEPLVLITLIPKAILPGVWPFVAQNETKYTPPIKSAIKFAAKTINKPIFVVDETEEMVGPIMTSSTLTIRVKITDLLSESIEMDINNDKK